MLFSSQDVIFRHCNYRYFVTMVCALSRIAQMTHFYVTRWGDGGGGQTILEYVLSRRTFSTKQCFSHWAIIVLWFNSWMKVKYHINKSNFFVLNFCTPWTWFFFCLVTIVIMHITLHVIINLQIVISGLSGFFMNFEFSTYLFITSGTPSTGRKSPFVG